MNKSYVHLVALGALSVLAVASVALGQPVPLPACSQGIPFFCADAAYFLDGDCHALEVYLGICNEALQFVKTRDGYRASADVMIVVQDEDDSQVTGDTFRIRLTSSDYGRTTSVEDCQTRAVRFRALPGRFTISISVSDRDSHRKSLLLTEFEIPDLNEQVALSDIVFTVGPPLHPPEGGGPEGTPGNPGSKGNPRDPNVRRMFGDESEHVTFYYELYNNGLEDSLNVHYEIFDGDRNAVYDRRSRIGAGAVTTVSEAVPIDSLSNGVHALRVSVIPQDGDPVAVRTKLFEVSTDAFYLGKDLEEAVALLEYIASSSFIERLVEADPAERKTLWDQFWREKDPIPSTPRNEFYDEHVKRYRYANKHFGSGGTEGWKTDRGRIYITYGSPDEIESRGMEVDADPTEIWSYFEQGARFVFVDETGFGDYVLVSGP
jgi:GWxTD domain-containing protein